MDYNVEHNRTGNAACTWNSEQRQELFRTASILSKQFSFSARADRGMHSIEIITLASLIKMAGCTTWIESGTYEGTTTSRIAELFPTLEIITIDDNAFHGGDKAKSVIAKYPNIELKIGNALKLIPPLLKERKNLCVFIDGPKGLHAIPLITKSLQSGVRMVGMHDACGEMIPSHVGKYPQYPLLFDPRAGLSSLVNSSTKGTCFETTRKATSGSGEGMGAWCQF